jgi:hypothetical protein
MKILLIVVVLESSVEIVVESSVDADSVQYYSTMMSLWVMLNFEVVRM